MAVKNKAPSHMHGGQHKFRNVKQDHSTANNVANLCEIILSIYELVFVQETKKNNVL